MSRTRPSVPHFRPNKRAGFVTSFAVPSPRSFLVRALLTFVAGAAFAFALRTLLLVDSNVLTAAATAALAVFAGVQVAREILASQRRRAATARRLTGAAWLARRSCEVILQGGVGYWNTYSVAKFFAQRQPLDRLEAHFREVLALSSTLGGETAAHGARAFEGFLAASDRFNSALAGSITPGHDAEMVNEALTFLYDAVVDLEQLAPRRAHETALPDPKMLGPAPPTPPSPPTPPGPSIPPPATTPPAPEGVASPPVGAARTP
jgi:hypothetical protein